MTHLSNCDVFELRGERKHSKQFNLRECRFEQLIIGCHGIMSDVIMTCNATKISNLLKNVWIHCQSICPLLT